MEIKLFLFCLINLSLISLISVCSSYQDGKRARPINIGKQINRNKLSDAPLINGTQSANDVTLIEPINSEMNGSKSSRMMMMGSFPLALIFGAKAIFLKKFLIGSLIANKCCPQTTTRPPATGLGGIPGTGVGGVGGLPAVG